TSASPSRDALACRCCVLRHRSPAADTNCSFRFLHHHHSTHRTHLVHSLSSTPPAFLLASATSSTAHPHSDPPRPWPSRAWTTRISSLISTTATTPQTTRPLRPPRPNPHHKLLLMPMLRLRLPLMISSTNRPQRRQSSHTRATAPAVIKSSSLRTIRTWAINIPSTEIRLRTIGP
ncbi:hypothetical protein CB0940_10379, partial [Cercospora beticola]